MKKRILGILLTLCMMLMLCPVAAFAETPGERYSLTLKFDHGTYRGCTGSYNKGNDYKSGDKYDVTKDFNEIVDFAPYVFVATKNVTGTFTDSGMVAEFIFAMPEYSIDIEVSGYAVGNTPADCKIENITSTIPDVSFNPEDKNDVLDIVWIDVDAEKTMSDTDVFQAEGTYEIDVTLAHKDGISILPLATVNGKLCRHCRQWDGGTFLVACYMEKPENTITKLIDVTIPYTTTVALGGVGEPGETTFELELIDGWGKAKTDDNVTVTAAVTTDGAGDYSGTMTITGPERTLWDLLSEDAFVRQVNAGEAGWNYDDTVWGLYTSEIAAYSTADSAEFTVLTMPASVSDEGSYIIDWDSIDWANPEPMEMTFTNTYTKTVTEPTELTKPTGLTPTTPATGDNSHMALWLALLFVSGAGVIGTTVYSKKKRAK